MKKIFVLLAVVLGCVSAHAQVVDVYNNGSLVNSYTNGGYNDYKVVLRENTSASDDKFPSDGTEHTLVDLGLSVKWAACNVGATSPYEVGNFYSWSAIATKENYTSSTDTYCNCADNYDHCSNAFHFTKYNYIDNDTVLVAADDAATVNWGSTYRMPTQKEFEELKTQCTWTWDATHKGYLVTATNGNSIFLPAAGYYDGANHEAEGVYGLYWSSSLYNKTGSFAYSLYFNSGSIYNSDSYRSFGYSVRPVAAE